MGFQGAATRRPQSHAQDFDGAFRRHLAGQQRDVVADFAERIWLPAGGTVILNRNALIDFIDEPQHLNSVLILFLFGTRQASNSTASYTQVTHT